MSKLNTLQDLLIHELKDLYNAETQLVKALPKMEKAATSIDLQRGFAAHLEETKGHVTRLESIFDELEASPKGKTCKAMQGLIAEGEEIIKEKAADEVRDAALIAAAQKVEHYEIAGYGTVRTYAELLGFDEIAQTLQETLDEEAATDVALTELAKGINAEADHPA